MHVYMDAVFYPNMYEKKEIMMQEGWHYEIDEETGELTYNGVVFNEMKGVYSSPEQQLYRIIEKSLLPHTAYGFESGGDPEAIPNLTQEDFIAFHKRYYHPSNSYIYLYGDMDAAEELTFIDEEYLQNFDYAEIDSALTDEPAFEKPVEVREYYYIAENESEQDNTYLTYNTVVGTSADKKLCTAFSILEYALLSAPGAPLKKALIDAGLGKDILSSFDDGIKQPNFSIIAKNANAEDLERFIQVLEDTLASIVEQGMDKKSLLAAINYFEFKHKEGNFGRFPKGLMLGLNAFSTWLYDDAAALDLFSLNDVYDALKQDVETGYFEALIKQYILQNTHKSYCLLMPKKGLNNEIAEREKARLAAYKETLSAADIEEIRANMMHLKEYQSSGDAEEDLKKIPMLAIDDIEKHAKKINNRILEIEHVKVLSHDIFTNGITYLSLNFCMDDIDYDKFPVIALLTEIFKYVDTEHFSYSELSNEINLYTGGIGFSTTVTNKKEYGGYVTHFVVSAKMLDAQLDKAMELIEEILFTSKLSDKKRLKEIIAETRAAMKDDLLANGHTTAAGRATAYISKIGVVKELTEGVDYYMYLSDLDVAQSAQQRRPAHRQIFLPRRAGIHHRLCGGQAFRGQLRQHHSQYGGFQIRPRLRGSQQLCQFLLNALGRDAVQVRCQLPRRPGGGCVQCKAEPCGKAVQPQNAQRILSKPLLRLTHCPQQTVLQVFLPAKWVYQTLGLIIRHGVDGKIPPGKILPHVRYELHCVRVTAIGIAALGAEGGSFVQLPAVFDGDRAVLQAGGDALLCPEQLHHLLRQGAGAQVPVVGGASQKTVPHAAAHSIGCVARRVQGVQQGSCPGVKCQLHSSFSS